MANIATITNNIISALSGTTSQVLLGDATLTDFKLDSLTDVNVPTPGDGDVLKWNASTSLWEASDNAGITGSGVAGQVAYFTGATTQGGSNNLFWDATNSRLGIGTNTPSWSLDISTAGATISRMRGGSANNQGAAYFVTQGGSNTSLLAIGDGSTMVGGAVNNAMIYVNGSPLSFSMGGTTQMTLTSVGRLLLGSTSDNGLRFQVTGDGYFSGSVGIGSTSLTGRSLVISKTITGATSSYGILNDGVIQPDVTSIAGYNRVVMSKAAGAATSIVVGYWAVQGTYSGTVDTQYGFLVDSTVNGATNNYAFFSNIASGTGRWNLYMNGTAANYLAGTLAIGNTNAYHSLQINSTANFGAVLKITDATSQATGAIALGDGFSSSLNVGIWRGANNSYSSAGNALNLQGIAGISFMTGSGAFGSNTERMRLDSSGNLSIGATSASYRLDVIGSGIRTAPTAGATGLWGSFVIGSSLDSTSQYFDAFRITGSGNSGYANTSNNILFQVWNGTAWNSQVFINQGSGAVGIGASPGFKLDVVSSSGYNSIVSRGASGAYFETYTIGGTRHASFGSESNGDLYLGSRSNNPLIFITNNTSVGRIDASGNLLFGSTSDAYIQGNRFVLSMTGVTDTLISFKSSATSLGYIYASTGSIDINANSRPLTFSTTGAEKARIFNNGNFAIGTTTDAGYKLDVNGTMRVNGATTITGSLGSVQVLASGAELYFTRNGNNDFYANSGSSCAISIGAQSHVRFLTGTTLTERARFDTTGNFSVDSGVFYVDAVNNRVGINDINPDYTLDVNGTMQVIGAATFSSSVTAASALISNYRLELPNMNIGYWDSTNNRIESTTRPMFFTSYGSGNNIYFGFDGSYGAMTLHRATSNTHIGGTTDTGEKLQVTGTMRVSGASTFNGNLTVDTNTLFVDATNNRVGVGTLTPNNVIEAVGSTFVQIMSTNTATTGVNRGGGFRATSTTNGGTSFLGDLNAISNNANAPYNGIDGIYLGSRTSGFPLGLTVNNGGTELVALNIASTGAATFSSSVSAASFIPTSSTIPTNGMYLPAADSIALSTTSTQRFRITSGGNIVINSDSADNGMKFQVIGTGYISSTLGVGTLPTYKLDVLTDGNNGIRTTSSAGQQLYLGNSAGTGVVGTLNNYSLGIITNSSIRATIDTNGNFGIGVSPSYKLHVSNNANSPLYIGATNTTAGNASSAGLLLTSNTASGSAEYQKRSSTATTYKTLFSNDLAIYNTTAGDITLLNDHINGKIEFAAGGASTPQITIDSAGRLLIGTISSSTYKLDVVGDARVSNILNVAGVVTLGDLAGTGTRIVVADTNGVLSTQATSTYLTSLTGEATSSGGGATTVTLTNSAVIGKVLTGLNVSAAVITSNDSILSAFGKIQGQIDALQGGTVYKGGWNANTNSPAITSGTGTSGHYYVVTTAGSTTIDGISSWAVGDWIIFNGTVWEKIVNVDAVTSVNGQTGAVSLTTSNINEGTNLYYTDARARAAISLTTTGSSGAATYSSGVLNIPTYTLSGLGGAASSRQLTINGTAYDLSADRSWSVGTVTSVGELTIGTSGTDITSTVSNGTSAAVITLNVPTASASNRGALSSADWSTFNSKEPAITAGTTAQYWRGDKSWQTLNTTAVTEGTNLYYTDTRARAAISLTTTGTSGAASYSSGVLNIPNYSLTITYNNNADASYQMLWGSGNAIYGTAGITCNPFTDSLTLTGSLISGGISVNGYGRMYGGDFWHSGIANNGTRTPTLKLGRFTDSDTSAYTIYADDTNGDILEFYSERYTADFRITRGSDSGVRNAVRINSDNGGSVIDVYTGDGSTLGAKIQSNGDARFAYDVVAYYSFSDARLKNNIATIQNPLQKVMAMRGVTYEWNEGYKAGKKEIGLIAQEVMEIIPEVVAEKERVDGSKFLSVDYEHLTGLLIEAVKELKKEVDELKSR